jgi:hypothetical protein
MLTRQDEENYGPELLDMSRRAALDALAPELQQLRAENQQLRGMAQRSQHIEIERALDRAIPAWREVYQNPAFSQWLSLPDAYSGGIRSQLMRQAVAVGDAHRVVQFYRGFLAEYGATDARSYQSRGGSSRGRTAPSGNIYTRAQIQNLYERRRRGEFTDAAWARTEQEIFNAANEGRIAGALDRDGNKLTELR